MTDDHPSGNGRAIVIRVAGLEVWRDHMDAWRLALTGVADTNGRIGELTRAVEELREDVGSPEECRATRAAAGLVRAVERKLIATLGAAALAVGGSAWGLIKSRDENIAAAARQAERLESIRAEIARNRLDIRDLRLAPSRAITPDPRVP